MQITRKMQVGEWTIPVTVYKYSHMDYWQAITFGNRGNTPDEVFDAVQKHIDAHKDDVSTDNDTKYQAQAAYACGYYD